MTENINIEEKMVEPQPQYFKTRFFAYHMFNFDLFDRSLQQLKLGGKLY